MDVDLGVVDVGVLGGGVVPPDDDVLHFVGGHAATHRHLQARGGRDSGGVTKMKYIFFKTQRNEAVMVSAWAWYLGAGSVVVQSGQAGEVLFGDGRSRLGGDQAVGVRWVSNHQNLTRKPKTAGINTLFV